MAAGIEFDETMKGAFALGETDPERGRAKGEADATELAMHATITIPDLERFVADRDHAAQLQGKIDFPPLGPARVAERGRFNLFSPTDDPDLKQMIYELAFEVDGAPRYLAGKKQVRNDHGFDLWSDTTTLYTTLHDGADASAAVIGAGVLTIDAGRLVDLLSTLRVIGADSVADRAATLARFGAFFMGELWDTYGPETLARFGRES